MTDDPRIAAVPDIHGHAKGEHKLYVDERPIPYTARMLFLWFFHACRRGAPRFLMVADHVNYLTFEDPAAVNLVRRALKLAQAGDLYGAAETAGVDVQHAAVVGDGLRRGMRYSIGAEVDNDPRSRPDAQNIVDAMRPDGIVRSVHFLAIKHPQFGENWMWPFDNPEFRDVYDIVGTEQTWELYMATLLDAIEKLPGHIVGHFYVPAKFGHWPSDDVLEAYEDRLLDACAERGMAVEINSRYYYKHALDDGAQLEKYSTANMRLLRKAKEKGVMVAVGSDAHSPKDQGHGFGEILALLDRAEINEIAFPIDGRLARVALRATEELRKASSKAAREERTLALPIPGTEDPEAADDEDAENTASGAERTIAAADRPAAAAPSAPKKRPSRAKKARVADSASSDAQPAEASHGEAPAPEPAEKVDRPAGAVEAISSAAKRVTRKVAATLQSRESKTAPPEPRAVESKRAAAETYASDEPAPEPQAVAAGPETVAAETTVPEGMVLEAAAPWTEAAEPHNGAAEDAQPKNGAEAGERVNAAGEAVAAEAVAADAVPAGAVAAEAPEPERAAADVAKPEKAVPVAQPQAMVAESTAPATEAGEPEAVAAKAAEPKNVAVEAEAAKPEAMAAEGAEPKPIAAEAADPATVATEAAQQEVLATEAAQPEAVAQEAADRKIVATHLEPEAVAAESAVPRAGGSAIAPKTPVAKPPARKIRIARTPQPQGMVAEDEVALEASKMPDKHTPGSAVTARTKARDGSSGAGARSRTKTSRSAPASSAKSAAKRSTKPAANVVRPSKAGAKKATASKGAQAPKKRVAKKAAPVAAKKVSRRSPSAAPTAKKATAKKAAPLRKASKTAPVKTASRSTGKKTGAKKSSAKKKTTKSRR